MTRTSGSPLQSPGASHSWLRAWKNLAFLSKNDKQQQTGCAAETRLSRAAAKISARMFLKKGVGWETNQCLTNAHDRILRCRLQTALFTFKRRQCKASQYKHAAETGLSCSHTMLASLAGPAQDFSAPAGGHQMPPLPWHLLAAPPALWIPEG